MRIWHLMMIATLAWCCSNLGAIAAPAPPKMFSDCTNCPQMVALPPGGFTMGISADQEKAQGMPAPQTGRSGPPHTVTFGKGYAISAYPITVAQFREFVEDSGYHTSDSCYSQHMSDGHFIYENSRGYTWRDPGFPQNDKHPVVCVNWDDAMAYAAWLSKKTGHQYSVPNEAQYEYAARGGTTTLFFWGDKRDATACQYANEPDLDQAKALNAPSGPDYRFQCSDGYAFTSPVGSFKPNPFGLYDMLGNIWEWTADCWNDNYNGAPTDGSTWKTGDCDAHPSHGGSYGNAVFSAYSAIRVPRDADYVGHSWGFRVVRND
jgi:formylglycine-generating enzyme required for sulfatase activity